MTERIRQRWIGALAGAVCIIVILAAAIMIFDPAAAQYRMQSAISAQELDPKYEERFIALDRGAIEQAYHEQIVHLFSTWMKDQSGQPARAIQGAKQARRAFISSMDAIEKRERELKSKQGRSP